MGAAQRSRQRAAGKRVVTIGGGTGPFAVLTHLKKSNCSISAIVTMADSGGSSRRLMDEFGQVPFGDLRQALVALSHNGALWREVFNYRFPIGGGPSNGAAESSRSEGMGGHGGGEGVGGHSLGNLILSALQEINGGDLLQALQDAQELLETAGGVLPVTLSHPTLCAELADGSTICGETDIDTRGEKHPGPLPAITRLYLDPRTAPCTQAIRAIRRADVIILGPGDLYTSILPNLLVDDIAPAIRESDARKVYVCNLMTKHGETDGYQASDFVREVHRYLGGRVNRVILHDGSFPERLIESYAEKQQHPVIPDIGRVQEMVPEVVVDSLTAIGTDHFVRHDPVQLVRAALAQRVEQRQPVMLKAAGDAAGLLAKQPEET
jgi:uncharacterized cofD-like protein